MSVFLQECIAPSNVEGFPLLASPLGSGFSDLLPFLCSEGQFDEFPPFSSLPALDHSQKLSSPLDGELQPLNS